MGGGDNFWILWGDTAVMRGDIELMGVPSVPPLGKTLHISCMVMSSEVTNTLSVPTVWVEEIPEPTLRKQLRHRPAIEIVV